jgi:predicted nucleotidyltransferase
VPLSPAKECLHLGNREAPPAEVILELCNGVVRWARARQDILAVALVGSHARGQPRADSDIDLILIATSATTLFAEPEWVRTFGPTVRIEREDWGLMRSLRVWHQNGLEVEYGLTERRWLTRPLDEGTRRVLESGFVPLYDPAGLLPPLQGSPPAPDEHLRQPP